MRRWIGTIAVVLFIARAAVAASPAEVQQAIDKAKAFLYSQQLENKTWEYEYAGHGDQKTGQTALAVYALLASGESRQDPRLVPAIAYLKKTDTTGVYALGLRCQIWLILPPAPDVRAAMTRDAGILLKSLNRTGKDGKGFYDYNTGGRNYSHSRAQYAVLGLWAAAQSGIEVPREYWKFVEEAWIDHQDPSGGWGYLKEASQYPITPGMTAVGIASLFITGDQLGSATRNPAIDKGMEYLTANFSKVATDERYTRDYPYSTLYAVERIGLASGQKYFGTIDWYEKGLKWLLSKQKKDGSFPTEHSDIKITTTCFAILFLTRGSAPIVLNKLDYSAATASGADKTPKWNQRSRDAANIARWIGRQTEHDLNWQVVNLESTTEDFLDSQILYLSGHQALEFSPEHEGKLKKFIEQGGIILGNAETASKNFAETFQSLGKRMFPAYQFAPLPENHVIYTNQQFRRADWRRKPNVLSMSNGVRELMILLAESDPARVWQDIKPMSKDEACQLAADIFLYSVDKQSLRRRGESYLVTPDSKVKPTRTIKLARLQYDGNWDPEPGGWPRLAAILHNKDKVALEVEPVKVEALASQKLAHLTGTAKVMFKADQRAALKKFLEAGGTLIVDAAGGSTDFASSVETELAAIVPDAKEQLLNPLPPDHVLFAKLEPIGYRNYARTKIGIIKSPQLRSIKVKNRPAVYYSKEDLTAGLVGQPVDGIVGYDPATATEIMRRIVASAR